jgi:hypothetical protein
MVNSPMKKFNPFFYVVSVVLLGCLVLAFLDPSFRPIFGEIVKALVSGVVQGLIAKNLV